MQTEKDYRYTVKTDSDRKKKSKWGTVCLKMYKDLGEKRKRIKTVVALKIV